MSDTIDTGAAAPTTSAGPDLAAIANRLYGGTCQSQPTMLADEPTKPATQPAAASTAAPANEAKATTESKPAAPAVAPAPGEVPESIRELRDDPLRRMFSPQTTFASVGLEEAMKHLPMGAETRAAEAAEWREIFEDVQASPQDARELVDAARRFDAEPMTPQRDMANVNSAIDLMNREFGNDAAKALADAQAMVKRDPRLVKILEQSRLGNDPTTVVKLARLARSQKQRG